MTAVSPATLQILPNAYPEGQGLHDHVAEAIHEAYKAIGEVPLRLGSTVPALVASMNNDTIVIANGRVPVEAVNYTGCAGIPEDRVHYHICSGGWRGSTPATSPRSGRPDAQGEGAAYSVEAANPRHEHEWMLWQALKLPHGKVVILGVVSRRHR